ncbi:MAG TPA: threonine--tRNA ligase, partial [Arachnia sp.]|nr:threonine--tRNA ligase [Arachnia sp.]
MSGVITVRRTDNAEQVELTTTTTGLDLFGDDRTVVAMRVNGETRDLQRELADGDEVSPVLIGEPEGLSILRHSAGHVTAQALQNLFAEAKLGIGPPIVDGFYYDFQTAPLTP